MPDVPNPLLWPPRVVATGSGDAGTRLDVFLARTLAGFSRDRVRALIRQGRVRVGGAILGAGARLGAATNVVIVGVPPEGAPLPVGNADLPLSVVYADEDVLIVDKPAGMASVPLSPDEVDTLVNALVARHPELRGIGHGVLDTGLVSRLDNETSGLVLVGRNAAAFAKLNSQREHNPIEKAYLALVVGQPPEAGIIEWPIAHAAADRRRMHATRSAAESLATRARPAHTSFRVVRRGTDCALVEACLHQGTRHQVRVHLAALGHPLVGDVLYGGSASPLHRHFLHASELRFMHPRTGVLVQCRSELPPDLRSLLETLGIVL